MLSNKELYTLNPYRAIPSSFHAWFLPPLQKSKNKFPLLNAIFDPRFRFFLKRNTCNLKNLLEIFQDPVAPLPYFFWQKFDKTFRQVDLNFCHEYQAKSLKVRKCTISDLNLHFYLKMFTRKLFKIMQAMFSPTVFCLEA